VPHCLTASAYLVHHPMITASNHPPGTLGVVQPSSSPAPAARSCPDGRS
jgi:hypothetical protein